MMEQLQVFEDNSQTGDIKYTKSVFNNALRWFVRHNDLTAQISAYPQMQFTHRGTGEPHSEHADEIVSAYKEYQREERRARSSRR